MKKLLLPCLFASLSCSAALAQTTQLDELRDKLDAIGNLRIDVTNFELTKEGNVIIKPPDGVLHFESDGMEVFAGKAEYLAATEQLRFSGDVAIYREGIIYRGEDATYSIGTRQLDASKMRSSMEPFFFRAGNISSSGSSEISVINLDSPEFTTDDSEDPSYRITADKVTLYPGDRVVFRKFKILAGDTPLFYLPYVSQTVDGEFGYTVVPGYRSNLGAFLLNQYSTTVGDHSLIKYKFDVYTNRGAGGGFDLQSRKYASDSKFGKFKFYWLYDSDPETSNTFNPAPRNDVDNSRYRVNLQHRVYLPGPEQGDLYVDVDLNKVSDEFFYEDFFQNDFRDDPQPDNIINFVKRHERGEISLLGRFRVNDFYQSDTRLPELSLERPRQPVWNTGLFYSGHSSIGVLEEHLGDDDEERIEATISGLEAIIAAPGGNTPENLEALANLRRSLIEPSFVRSHSWNEFYYPLRFENGAVTLTPRMGLGYTSYSSVDGPDPDHSGRFIFSAGLDASFKMSRVYDNVVIPSLGIDGIRHIVQPYASWSFVSADELGDQFIGIDRLVPSTRPRPLEVSNWTAIDSLRDWNIVRLGVSNRFQTRRNNTTYNWLTTNTYIDAFLDDPEYDRDFSNLYQDVEWRPLPWAKFSVGAQLPISDEDGNFTEVNTRATFMPTSSLEFSIGHRALSNHPVFRDSSLVDFGAYARINENWGFSVYERYEMDDNTLETQQYSLHRDLTNWVATLGAVIRDHRDEEEWGLLLSLTLKDFPAVRVPVDFDPQGGRQ